MKEKPERDPRRLSDPCDEEHRRREKNKTKSIVVCASVCADKSCSLIFLSADL